MTPEGHVKRRVKFILAQFGDRVWGNWPVPGGYGRSTLDFIGCHRGMLFAIETKAPGEKMTPRQELEAEKIAKAGGQVFEIDDERGIELLWTWLHRP